MSWHQITEDPDKAEYLSLYERIDDVFTKIHGNDRVQDIINKAISTGFKRDPYAPRLLVQESNEFYTWNRPKFWKLYDDYYKMRQVPIGVLYNGKFMRISSPEQYNELYHIVKVL